MIANEIKREGYEAENFYWTLCKASHASHERKNGLLLVDKKKHFFASKTKRKDENSPTLKTY